MNFLGTEMATIVKAAKVLSKGLAYGPCCYRTADTSCGGLEITTPLLRTLPQIFVSLPYFYIPIILSQYATLEFIKKLT